MYPLQPLLRVRLLREENANLALIAKRTALAQAIQDKQQKQQKLSQYHDWRQQQEHELFEKVRNRTVSPHDLEELKSSFATLRGREVDLETQVTNAENHETRAEEAKDQAVVSYRAALTGRQKIDQHREIWSKDWQREQNRLEDLEMEEFKGRPPEDMEL